MSTPVTAQLYLIQGAGESFQQVIDLHNVNQCIGRGQNCDVIWSSLQISRRHATLEYMLPKWYIRDLSTNGISINNNKLVKGELFPLNDTDIINFIPTGTVQYRFRYVYNSPPRSTLGSHGGNSTNSLGTSLSPQPSTSRIATASSVELSSRPGQVEARGRPSVEVIGSDNGNQSDSESSNHSESLLSLDPPDADFLSFSGDDHDQAEAESSSLPSLFPESDENSLGPFASKRKHGESDSDSNSLLDRKKKRMQRIESSSGGEEDESCEKSDVPIPSTSSCSRGGFLTDDQISTCGDLEKLKVQLRQCLTKLASTEVKLKTVECERAMDKEEYGKKENDMESITAAVKEENYKKIMDLVESELSCSVCNEVFIQATVIECGHTFCSFCITEWSKKKQECPICRKGFRNRSRHIELENFVTKMYESFSEEISTKRLISIKDREDQVKKAEEAARVVQLAGRPGAPGVNNANFHTFMQRTAETYVDFLAELHQFNELLGPSRNAGRGNGASTAAERRRSTRIQDRVIDAVATGAATGAAGPTPRSARRAGRPRRTAAAAAQGGLPPVANPAPAIPPLPSTLRQQNPNGVHRPVVVNLDESSNGGNGNPAQPLRFSNQLLNWLF